MEEISRGLSTPDPVRPHLAVQIAALQPQKLGRPDDVSARLIELFQDELPLEALPHLVPPNLLARREDHHPLYDVLQLAHVARPAVGLQGGQGLRPQRPHPAVGAGEDAGAGMSSTRSRSGGTRRGTTFSRKYRSSRNRAAPISAFRSLFVAAMTRTSTRRVDPP